MHAITTHSAAANCADHRWARTRGVVLMYFVCSVTRAHSSLALTPSTGDVRMLVLLYFHINGFDPISLAFLFLLYEFMGMVTNLGAGWIAARYGLNLTLYAGLVLQVGTLALLAVANPTTVGLASVLLVMGLQGLEGGHLDSLLLAVLPHPPAMLWSSRHTAIWTCRGQAGVQQQQPPAGGFKGSSRAA